jgi:hypothetical protein
MKPRLMHAYEWNEMLDAADRETDRGAALLMSSFAETALGGFLLSKVSDDEVRGSLFGSNGPLSSFSQRIAVAYAFGFISREHFDNLTIVRRVRNHFAHHPFDATFASEEVAGLASRLSTVSMAQLSSPATPAALNRAAYMFACALFATSVSPKLGQTAQTGRTLADL